MENLFEELFKDDDEKKPKQPEVVEETQSVETIEEVKQNLPVKNLSDSIIKTKDFVIEGVEFFIGQRVRMKENINRLKTNQLVEILSVNKDNEIQVLSVYDGSKTYVSVNQISFD